VFQLIVTMNTRNGLGQSDVDLRWLIRVRSALWRVFIWSVDETRLMDG
jgi:hypothetical protein